jgi:hypothetical protein
MVINTNENATQRWRKELDSYEEAIRPPNARTRGERMQFLRLIQNRTAAELISLIQNMKVKAQVWEYNILKVLKEQVEFGLVSEFRDGTGYICYGIPDISGNLMFLTLEQILMNFRADIDLWPGDVQLYDPNTKVH